MDANVANDLITLFGLPMAIIGLYYEPLFTPKVAQPPDRTEVPSSYRGTPPLAMGRWLVCLCRTAWRSSPAGCWTLNHLLTFVAAVLLAIAILRGRVYPRWTAYLMMLNAILALSWLSAAGSWPRRPGWWESWSGCHAGSRARNPGA